MKYQLYLLMILVILGCGKRAVEPSADLKVVVEAITISSIVGKGLEFQFQTQGKGNLVLLLENSFGPILFQPKITNDKVFFVIPPEFTEQAGEYSWRLIGNSKVILSDYFYLDPDLQGETKIETYFGPRSIRAGGEDYSMLTIIPTDVYDNPLSDSTRVSISQQINAKINVFEDRLKYGIAWRLLYGEEKSGRMLVTAAVNRVPSKELTSIISPSNSTNFSISLDRVHGYADGNQVISFMTSRIKDKYGNTVSDGTLVNFIVKNSKGEVLKTLGTTLGGIATANMLHPSEAEDWQVIAYVTGESESGFINVNFKSSVKDFEVNLSESNREITVGPITAYMGQLVPEGLLVQLKIFDNNGNFIEEKQINSKSGIGSFELDKGFYPNGKYQITVQCAGIKKEMTLNLTHNGME